jgi:hypothetical protein
MARPDRPFAAVSGTEQTQWNINRSLYVGEGVVFSGEWGFLPAWGQL